MLGGVHWGRLRALIRKEFRQMLRDPRAKRLIFVAPVVQLMLFGYAVNTDVRHAATIVVDQDRTAESRELVETLTASGYFRLAAVGTRPADIANALDHGDAIVGLDIPRGFAADLHSGRGAGVQLLVDGTSSNTALVAMGYAAQIVTLFGAQAACRGAGVPACRGAGVDLRARAWYNPNLLSRVYNVPGVIATIMMLMGLLLTSLGVVREREIGTLEQLMVSPLSPAELILGKTVPVVAIAFIQLAIIVSVALLWFRIPFEGSFLLLLVAAFFYILSGLGLGLLISTVSATQQEAFMTMFFIFMPLIILSGFMYPVENMPTVFQHVTLFNPLRHFLVVVRGIFLKGAGVDVLWPQLVALAVMGTAILFVAAGRFRKTTD
jgi:ABC-2 type transport system permease protein